MHNIIKKNGIIVSLGILLMLSCTNLNEQFLDSYATKEALVGGEVPNPDGLLRTVHNALVGTFTTQDQIYALQEHSSDELMGPTRGTDWDDHGVWRTLHQHAWDPAHPRVNDVWNALNSAQANASLAVDNIASGTQNQAEARFWRAFIMYHLVDLYGQVPFRDADQSDPFAPASVMSRQEGVSFIIADLEAAIPNLAAEGSDDVTLDTENPPYKSPTKEAAYALLMKVYLNKFVYMGESSASGADMDKVIEYADDIISSGNFSLVSADDYFKIFYPVGPVTTENVFVMKGNRFDGVGNIGAFYYQGLHYNQNPGGWNGFTTLATFYDSFESSDVRLTGQDSGVTAIGGPSLGFLAGQQYGREGASLTDRGGAPLSFTKDVPIAGANERQGIRVVKWLPDYDVTYGDTNHDYVYIRYADVLLMKAEALWRKGDPAGAMTIINDLRSNRGVSDIASILADGQEILDERGRELYWEGHRRTDLIRFGKFNDAWEEKSVTPEHTKIYPIPQTSIDANPNLQQNPGY